MTDPSRRLAVTLTDELTRCGLTDVCLAPGSRSTPLVLAFAEHPAVRLHVHLDERAAAFFGSGLARATGRPVAVLCTSGTAAANFHPAVLEAHHGRIPLLVLTADRPARLRDAGANQTTDQVRLYGLAVRWFRDLSAEPAGGRSDPQPVWRWVAARAWAEAAGPPAGPVHLNVAFDEPLVPAVRTWPADRARPAVRRPADGRPGGAPWSRADRVLRELGPTAVEHLAERCSAVRRGLIVTGWGSDVEPAIADAFAAATGWPVLADPLSGLRRGPHAVARYDSLLRAGTFARDHRPDLVLRLGAPPTSRALLEWLDPDVPQLLVDPDGAWQDPEHAAATRLRAEPGPLLAAVAARIRRAMAAAGGSDGPASTWQTSWREADRKAGRAIDTVLDGETAPSEPRAARDVVGGVPDGTTLVVGSSMPVRDVDSFGPPREGLRWIANRGLSGIDGFVATALGVAAASVGPVVALCGDLTFLHDAPSVLGAARRSEGAVFVVLDNDGGGIFSFLPQARLSPAVFEPLFATPHGLDLVGLARAAGLPARRVAAAAELLPAVAEGLAAGGSRVLVVTTDRTANRALHRSLLAAVEVAVDRAD